MKIEQIKVENYRVLKNAEIRELSGMSVFLGANGSGKSTFFDVFGFLSDALINNVTTAVNVRGRAKEVLSRGCDPEKDALFFELKFRDPQAFEGRPPLITYSLRIIFEDNKAIVDRELLKYRRGQYGQPWHFLDFSKGKGFAIENEEDYGKEGAEGRRTEQTLSSPDILAIKGLGQFEKFKAISSFRSLLEGWYISNFMIEEGRKISDTGISEHLSRSGDNLAQVTKYIYESHPTIFQKILTVLPKRIPGIEQVEARETEDGRIVLRFKDENFKDPFVSRYVSDGTLKMFAYMVLLYDPSPHPLLCIEEPENFLHPDLLKELAEELREYADRGGQVFVSTHSPDFIDALAIEELYFLKKESGFSIIKAVKDDPLANQLYQDQNQLGWLWRNKYISGANLSV